MGELMVLGSNRSAGWRNRYLAGFVAAALMVASACADDSDDTSDDEVSTDTAVDQSVPPSDTAAPATDAPSTEPPGEGEPTRGGTITIAVEAESDRFDPGNGNIAIPTRAIHHLVYGSLTAARPDGTWVPYLAESVTPNDDATQWTITLRPGLTFHDGNPLDGAALKASMDRFRLETLAAPAFTYITAVDVVDDLSVNVTLDKSFGVFPQVLADELGTIVSIAAVEQYGESYGDHPTGAGPYKLVEYVRDDHLTLEKVEGFFMENRGWADEIIFRPIPDDAGRSAALRAGDVDIISTSNPTDIVSFRDDDSFKLHEIPNGAAGVLFNITKIPDIRVRQAVAMAVDRESLIDLVWNGVGDPVVTPFPSDSFWYKDVGYPEYDPDGAAALIAEVEAETGAPVAFTIVSSVDETSTNYKIALAEQLRAVGIDIEVVDATDGNDYVDRYITGNYDITTAGVFAILDPWFEYTRRYASDSVLNGTGFESETLDAALVVGAESTDPDERKAAYDTVQQELADNMVQMFVRSATTAIITSDNIDGFGSLVGPDGEQSIGNFPVFLLGDEFWRTDI